MPGNERTPRVNVVIPAFNAGRYLGETIESALRQTFTDFEIIVVDDGSSDDTAEVAGSFSDSRLRYVRQDNQGQGAARNTGARVARGEYLTFLDSDDVLLPTALREQVAALDTQPELGLIVGGWEYIDGSGLPLGEEKPWEIRPDPDLESVLLGGLGPPAAVLIRREWFERVGGFDPDPRLVRAEDMDLWYRLGLAGCRMAWLRAVTCQYRVHDDNASWKVQDHYRARDLALAKFFASGRLPAYLYTLQGRVYARVRLLQAGRLYAIGDTKAAEHCIRDAIDFDSDLCADSGRRLVEAILAWDSDIWCKEKNLSVRDQLVRLPDLPVSRRNLRQRFSLAYRKQAVYQAYQQHDFKRIRELWLSVSLHDPSWLVDRGTWSILLQSLGILEPRTGDLPVKSLISGARSVTTPRHDSP